MGDFGCQPQMNDRPGIGCPVVRTRKLDKIYETAAFRQWDHRESRTVSLPERDKQIR